MNLELTSYVINIVKGILSICVLIAALLALYRGRDAEVASARDRAALLHLINVVEKNNIGGETNGRN